MHIKIYILIALNCLCNEISPQRLWPQCKVNVKWVGNFFAEVHYFASFVRNLALNNMQISYL